VTPMARLVLLQASTADCQQTRACREHASLCGSPECSTEVPVVRREIHMPDMTRLLCVSTVRPHAELFADVLFLRHISRAFSQSL